MAEDSKPACHSVAHSEFDFWLGSWEVSNADGSNAGHNTIEKIQDNCVLRETWRSANAVFTGTSYNFYNQQTKQWEQLWLDNKGGRLKLTGNKRGKQMILRTQERVDDDQRRYFHRITWTANDNGSVRQLWETISQTKSAGKTTKVVFDGLYKKAK